MDKIPDAVIHTMASKVMGDYPMDGDAHEAAMRDIRTALKAAEAAGYVLVPREPTEAMQDAGNKMAEGMILWNDLGPEWNDDGALNVWNVMLAAAHKVP